MKVKFLLYFMSFFMVAGSFAQKGALTLTFTALDNTSHMHFDGIKIVNRTQNGELALYWPDTVLTLSYLGVDEMDKAPQTLVVNPCYPNPASDRTTISLYIPGKDRVDILITDVMGRQVINAGFILEKGCHDFNFIPGEEEVYFFTATWRESKSSIRILHNVADGFHASSLEYIGHDYAAPSLKTEEGSRAFPFNPGDQLLYIAYKAGRQTAILDIPLGDKNYTFQFASGIPCPGNSTVDYEGQVYNTVQIFSQCWLKENLNVGTMIPADLNMTDNDIVEKYCQDQIDSNCSLLGGLYQWDEMMKYTTTLGAQGICPPGWHIPTSEEWKVLEGSVDSLYGIGDPMWDYNSGVRGYDAGTNLKSDNGWYGGGNGIDRYGFSGLPGGRCSYGSYSFKGSIGFWWTSRSGAPGFATQREMNYASAGVTIDYDYSNRPAFSVRCLKNE